MLKRLLYDPIFAHRRRRTYRGGGSGLDKVGSLRGRNGVRRVVGRDHVDRGHWHIGLERRR
jgi:hypothetical protein